MVRNSTSDPEQNLSQVIYLNQTAAAPFTVSAVSKAMGITGSADSDYSIWVDMYNDSGGYVGNGQASFAVGTHEWERLAVTLNLTQAIQYVRVYVILRGSHTGTAYFDAIRLQEGQAITGYQYDANNNYQTGITDPYGKTTSFGYDSAGNNTSFTDAKGNRTDYTYNNLDQLTSVAVPGYDLKTQFFYDANGNLTQLKNTSKDGLTTYNTTSYNFNYLDQVSSITDPLNKITSFSYDGAGNLSKIDYPNSNNVSFSYNSANRLTDLKYNGADKYRFSYDPNGNRTSVQDVPAGKTWSYSYDRANRLTGLTNPHGSVSYQYDKNSNLTSQTVSIGGNNYTSANTFNFSDQNISVAGFNGKNYQLGYDEKGSLNTLTSGNNTVASWDYDGPGRLVKITNYKEDGSAISSLNYQYDDNGNISQVYDNLASKAINYTYDALNQLLSETDPLTSNTLNYEYDNLGNRTKKIIKDSNGNTLSTTTYQYDAANQLISINGGAAWTYDNNGNLTNNGAYKFTWDAGGRVTEVRRSSDNSLVASYTYDADGRRVSATVSGVTTNFHYDGDSIRVLYETDASGNLKTLFNYSADGLLLSMTNNFSGTPATYFYHYNGHGDVIALTDSSGNTVAEYKYDAFGNIVSKAGSMADANPYRYAGYRYDTETGLYYLIARYYDPGIGRFISRDPDQGYENNPLSRNPYIYVGNNPVMQVDPDGEAAWWVAAALGGAAFDAGIYIWQHRNGGFEWSGLGKSALRGAITGVAFGAAGKLASKAITAARVAKVARGMSKVGHSFGSAGKLVKNPGIKVNWGARYNGPKSLTQNQKN